MSPNVQLLHLIRQAIRAASCFTCLGAFLCRFRCRRWRLRPLVIVRLLRTRRRNILVIVVLPAILHFLLGLLLPLLLPLRVLLRALAQACSGPSGLCGGRRRGRRPADDVALWQRGGVHLCLFAAAEALHIFLRREARADLYLFADALGPIGGLEQDSSRIGCKIEELGHPLLVSTPGGSVIATGECVLKVPVEIQQQQLVANLILFKLQVFDVISRIN